MSQKLIFNFQIMYYIISFYDWCSIVPEIWLNFKDETFSWPPKDINITKAITKNITPKTNWIRRTFRRITGPYGNYKQLHYKIDLTIKYIHYFL